VEDILWILWCRGDWCPRVIDDTLSCSDFTSSF